MAALAFSAVNIIQGIGLGITSPIIPIFAEKQFMSGYTEIGILYAVGLGMASMVVQIPGGKLASRYSKKKITFLTTAFSAPFFGLFALSRSFMEATFLMFLSYAIINFSWPAYQDLMMELTPASRWGLMNGLAATCNGIGMTIGSAMSGVLWENFGMFVPFYVSALFVLVSSVPYLFLSETANKT
jgi:predicted MFS family arabinose efflux permease